MCFLWPRNESFDSLVNLVELIMNDNCLLSFITDATQRNSDLRESFSEIGQSSIA